MHVRLFQKTSSLEFGHGHPAGKATTYTARETIPKIGTYTIYYLIIIFKCMSGICLELICNIFDSGTIEHHVILVLFFLNAGK